MDELAAGLTAVNFDNFVKLSYNIFTRTHTDEYAQCPTPDCDTIFRRTPPKADADLDTPADVEVCVNCLCAICTSCVASHEGLSCRAHHIRARGDEAFNTYLEEENAKLCPRCSRPMEKTGGCNHMECLCGAHFCWLCQFHSRESNRVYLHLQKEHGGFGGDEAMPVDPEEIELQQQALLDFEHWGREQVAPDLPEDAEPLAEGAVGPNGQEAFEQRLLELRARRGAEQLDW